MTKLLIAVSISLTLLLAACGSNADPGSGADEQSTVPETSQTTGTAAIQTTIETTASGEPNPDEPSGVGEATVLFTDDGTTLQFSLDECITSDSSPGNFAAGVAEQGAFSVHGTSADGWELNLSILPDANGDQVNFSFLTNGDDIDYELGDLTYMVDGNTVSASSNADIYQTRGEVEAVPLEFEASC